MPTFTVAKTRGKAKMKISQKRQAAMERLVDTYSEDFDVRMSVIQDLIPLGLKAVAEELQGEVKRLAGEKHSRCGANARWGSQNGSVYLRDQKVPVRVPRVRNVRTNAELRLETYHRLQAPFHDDGNILRRPGDAALAAPVVPGDVVRDEPEVGGQCVGAATGVGRG